MRIIASLLFLAIVTTFTADASVAETITVQVSSTPPITYIENQYGDYFETTWTSNFKRSGNCKNAQLQFESKRFLNSPEKRAPIYGFYFYSSDFKEILDKEGMYSKRLEAKSGRLTFDFFFLDEQGKGGKLPADVIRKCLTLSKSFKSPLNIHYYLAGQGAPYESPLVATIAFKEKE